MSNRERLFPCGVEAFDKEYGLGYEVGHDDYSPYDRINKLRRTFLDREFDIDIERARLVTESYKKNESDPSVLKCAKALAYVLDNANLHIYEDELIIGDIAAPAKAAPIYPEFSSSWIEDELLHHPFDKREHDKFFINDRDKKELFEILAYWRGHTVSDAVDKVLSEEELRGNEHGDKVYMTNLYHYGGIGHFIMDYEKLLRIGFGGLLEEARSGFNTSSGDSHVFYEAVVICLEAAIRYIKRYAILAQKMASIETDPNRKKELYIISDNCKNISKKEASSFWEALQLWHFATTIVQIESNGHSVSYGRMDQWLYPYYAKDIENGTITKEFAEELIECAYIRMGNPSKLKDKDTIRVRNGRGWGGESLTIGGVDKDGNDATNDLTYMMLEASAHTRMMNPWVCLRVHNHTPHELKVKAFSCIRAGFGHPKLYNDETAIKIMQKKGVCLEEARNYAVVGCVEPDLPGCEFGLHDAAYVNMVKVLDLALDRLDCNSDIRMNDVLSAFESQLDYWIDLMCKSLSSIEKAHRDHKPTPFASSFFCNCMKSGKDLTGGGARLNFTGPQACGIASVADALSTINQLVFDEKRFTLKELMEAAHNDYIDNEYLYRYINSEKVHHFGNDDEYADKYYVWVFNTYCRLTSSHKNSRRGTYTPGVYSVNANVGMGLNTPGSLDGRKSGEPLSDNMGPVHTAVSSHDIYGPTAISNSVNKVDHSLATNGTLLNWKFTPDCVSGGYGLRNLISFTDSYFKKGALHCQFNIMSSSMMKEAMNHPEKYKDMLVRVAGYSAYFVELSRPLQLDLINRTELHF